MIVLILSYKNIESFNGYIIKNFFYVKDFNKIFLILK